MKILHTAHRLFMESLLIGCGMEIEITTKDLITALTTQDHLDPHPFDLSAQQIHWGRRTDGGHIVGFQMVNNVRQGVETVFQSKSESIVLGAQELSNLDCSLRIRSIREADRE